ncbi:MAG: hypothetical protein ABH833_01165 [Parcubacteria group bacterium]
MSELFNTLGINGKLLIAQAVNFLVLLVILRAVVYKPLLKVMQERRERIEFGLKGAEEADRRLAEIDEVKEIKLKEADEKALKVIGASEETAKKRWHEIVSEAEGKADSVLQEAQVVAKQRGLTEMEAVYNEANQFVRSAIERTCELDPSKIDDQLIGSAVKEIKQSKA